MRMCLYDNPIVMNRECWINNNLIFTIPIEILEDNGVFNFECAKTVGDMEAVNWSIR